MDPLTQREQKNESIKKNIVNKHLENGKVGSFYSIGSIIEKRREHFLQIKMNNKYGSEKSKGI